MGPLWQVHLGLGIIDPAAGALTQGAAASIGDLIGQEVSDWSHCRSFKNINVPEAAGAGLGGFDGNAST
jgi:hypothetical protein